MRLSYVHLKKSLENLKIGVIRSVSNIRVYRGGVIWFGDSSYHLKGPECRDILNVLKPGDLLLRRFDHYLGALAIPGYWCHVAIYVGNNLVIQMSTTGINSEDILTFLRSDNIIVLRPNIRYKHLTSQAIEKAYQYLPQNIPYDFEFNFKDASKMSCTELIRDCYNYPEFYTKKLKNYIVPDDFLHSIFDIIWKRK